MNKRLFLANTIILLSLATQPIVSMDAKDAKDAKKISSKPYIAKEEKIKNKIEEKKQKEEKRKEEKEKIEKEKREQEILEQNNSAETEQRIEQIEYNAKANNIVIEEQTTTATNTNLKKSRLIELRMVTPTPTKKFYPYGSFQQYFNNERDLLLTDLESNAFDIDNMEYHTLINRAISDCIDYDEHPKLIKILKLIREKHCGKIKPDDIQTSKAHKYLTTTHKEKLDLLKSKSVELNKERLVKLNNLLLTMQKEFTTYVSNTKDILDAYIDEMDKKTTTSSNDIRESKEALLRIHQLNRTFTLGDGYCSDEEDHPTQPGYKAVKHPDSVLNFYGDVYILNKIGVDTKSENTTRKINERLNAFSIINKNTQNMLALTYIEDRKNNHAFNEK